MACETKQRRVEQNAANKSGLAALSNKAASVAGSTGRAVSGLVGRVVKPLRRGEKKAKAEAKAKKKNKVRAKVEKNKADNKSNTAQKKKRTRTKEKTDLPTLKNQASFFSMQPAVEQIKVDIYKPRPRIDLSKAFKAEELQQISVQLALGGAATDRHLREVAGGTKRGIGYSDPRAGDWIEADRANYRFLSERVNLARRQNGIIETKALTDAELVDLYEFSQYEADRAQRSIDHLLSGWSHLKGPTAEYLTEQHRLNGRFYSFIAAQLEPHITVAMKDAALHGELSG